MEEAYCSREHMKRENTGKLHTHAHERKWWGAMERAETASPPSRSL